MGEEGEEGGRERDRERRHTETGKDSAEGSDIPPCVDGDTLVYASLC